MFNIGAGEMVLILVAALLILGPQRLPELARGIGKFVREFRRQTDEVRNVVEREFYAMDQDFQKEAPPPPARPGSPFGRAPPPPALPSPDVPAVAAPAPGEQPQAPAEPAPAQVLELGLDGPRPLEPAALESPDSQPMAAGPVAAEPPSSTPPSAAGESPGADGLPRLAPIPGTVARNAPKRS